MGCTQADRYRGDIPTWLADIDTAMDLDEEQAQPVPSALTVNEEPSQVAQESSMSDVEKHLSATVAALELQFTDFDEAEPATLEGVEDVDNYDNATSIESDTSHSSHRSQAGSHATACLQGKEAVVSHTQEERDLCLDTPASGTPQSTADVLPSDEITIINPFPRLNRNYQPPNSPPTEPPAILEPDEEQIVTLRLYSTTVKSGGTENAYNVHAKLLRGLGHTVVSLYKARKQAQQFTGTTASIFTCCRSSRMAYVESHANKVKCDLKRTVRDENGAKKEVQCGTSRSLQ